MAVKKTPQQTYQQALKKMPAEARCFGIGIVAGTASVHVAEAVRSYKEHPDRAARSLRKAAGVLEEAKDIGGGAKEAGRIADRIKSLEKSIRERPASKKKGLLLEIRSISKEIGQFMVKRWRRCGLPRELEGAIKA